MSMRAIRAIPIATTALMTVLALSLPASASEGLIWTNPVVAKPAVAGHAPAVRVVRSYATRHTGACSPYPTLMCAGYVVLGVAN
jgi:hypothetical protein